MSVAPPSTIAVDPAIELRASLHQAIAGFNGESVRPSIVAASNRRPNKEEAVDDVADEDALLELFAALSFTPRDSMINKDILVPSAGQGPSKFNFASPLKSPTSFRFAPMEFQQQSTPTTVTTSGDKSEEDTTAAAESPKEGKESTASTTTTTSSETPLQSPSPRPNFQNAAVSAYSLSLPVEQDASTTSTHNSNVKKCKKFPVVDTNIPGAGTLRSSMSYKKAAVKLPFVPIAESKALTKRNADGLANHIYQHVKGVWASGKGIGVIAPFMNLTEGAISLTAGVTTGNGDLEVVDHIVVEPLVTAVDQHVLNPVLGFVGGILGWDRN